MCIVYSVILEMGIPERGHARGGHRDMGGAWCFPDAVRDATVVVKENPRLEISRS